MGTVYLLDPLGEGFVLARRVHSQHLNMSSTLLVSCVNHFTVTVFSPKAFLVVVKAENFLPVKASTGMIHEVLDNVTTFRSSSRTLI
jgi:hypothetical protein